MKSELDKALCEKYPKMFVNRHADMKTTAMCWGFECGDGWYNILDTLCEALTNSYTTCIDFGNGQIEDAGDPPQVIVTQVKEKFGTLRFYYYIKCQNLKYKELCAKYGDNHAAIQSWISDYEKYYDGAVHMAEVMSSRTCEVTGQQGELHSSGGTRNGWLKTMSREHAKTSPEYNYVPWSEIKNEKNTETV